MEPRLIPLNATLALLRGDGGWPTPLRDQGLRCERLELPVTTSRSLVVIDVLAHNEPCTVVVPIEAKSGANVERDQAEKYLAMAPGDVHRVTTMPGYSRGTVIQPLVVCLAEHEARIRKGLSDAESVAGTVAKGSDLGTFAILVVSEDKARLDPPQGCPLDAFDVEIPGPPPRIVPFDAESPDDVIQDPLLTAIVSAMSAGKDRVSVADLLASVIPYWSVYGRGVRNTLSKRASQVLTSASERELREFFTVVKGGGEHDSDIVRITKNPVEYKPQGQTQGWQGLRRAAHRYLRKSPAPQIPGQASFDALFDEAEATEDG